MSGRRPKTLLSPSRTELKKRSLTNLNNQRPTWLDNAYRRLEEAVFTAYRRIPLTSAQTGARPQATQPPFCQAPRADPIGGAPHGHAAGE
jgi:hypothetical protein